MLCTVCHTPCAVCRPNVARRSVRRHSTRWVGDERPICRLRICTDNTISARQISRGQAKNLHRQYNKCASKKSGDSLCQGEVHPAQIRTNFKLNLEQVGPDPGASTIIYYNITGFVSAPPGLPQGRVGLEAALLLLVAQDPVGLRGAEVRSATGRRDDRWTSHVIDRCYSMSKCRGSSLNSLLDLLPALTRTLRLLGCALTGSFRSDRVPSGSAKLWRPRDGCAPSPESTEGAPTNIHRTASDGRVRLRAHTRTRPKPMQRNLHAPLLSRDAALCRGGSRTVVLAANDVPSRAGSMRVRKRSLRNSIS